MYFSPRFLWRSSIFPTALIPQPFGNPMLLWAAAHLVTVVLPPHLYGFKSNSPCICNGLWSVILMPRWVCHVYLQNGIKVTDFESETITQPPQMTCAWVDFPPSFCSGTFPPCYIHDVYFKQNSPFLFPSNWNAAKPDTQGFDDNYGNWDFLCLFFSITGADCCFVAPNKAELGGSQVPVVAEQFQGESSAPFSTSCTNAESNQPLLHSIKCSTWVHENSTLLLLKVSVIIHSHPLGSNLFSV